MKFRTMSDGSLMAPVRGKPPDPPIGYIRSAGNPFIFLPVLVACKHRVKKEKKSSCCGDQMLDYCDKDKKYLTYAMCNVCCTLEGKKLYQDLYNDPGLHYGSVKYDRCPGVRFLPNYLKHLISPIIDLGCGTGETMIALREKGFTVDGADWVDLKEPRKVCDITEPMDLAKYKTSICLDVFEHILDESLLGLIKNMQQTKFQVISVYCGPSKEPKHSQELHINIKTPPQWDTFLSNYFELIEKIALNAIRYIYLLRTKRCK